MHIKAKIRVTEQEMKSGGGESGEENDVWCRILIDYTRAHIHTYTFTTYYTHMYMRVERK